MFEFEYIFDLLKKNIIGVAGVLFGLFAIGGSALYVYNYPKPICEESECPVAYETPGEKVEKDETLKFKVDVKGAVKKPGVYELSKGSTIYDAVIKSGGITSKGTTININLSKKLEDEMVIYVFTKDELKKKETVNEVACEIPKCECETVTVVECPDKNGIDQSGEKIDDEKVSINTGSKEDLLKISGLGDAKAGAIIEYREKNGSFKTLEEIKNVSGIGDALFEKIKDKIKL